jgi:Bacterial Ig domain
MGVEAVSQNCELHRRLILVRHRADFLLIAFLVLDVSWVSEANAADRQSIHYAIAMSTIDSGGGSGNFQSPSTRWYVHEGSMGGVVDGSPSTSATTSQSNAKAEGGFLSQLNYPPVPGFVVLTRSFGKGANAAVADFLSVAFDPDGDPFSLTVEPRTLQGGMAVATADAISYEPPPQFSGSDQISYRLTDDGGDSSTGIAHVVVVPQAGSTSPIQLLLNFPSTGGAHIVFAGDTEQSYQVQVTESLVPPVYWTGLMTVPSPLQIGLFEAVDLGGTGEGQRYYRTIGL